VHTNLEEDSNSCQNWVGIRRVGEEMSRFLFSASILNESASAGLMLEINADQMLVSSFDFRFDLCMPNIMEAASE